MDGKSCCLTVDSGAERTFVQGGVLATGQPPVAQQQLCGITGHCTQLRGPVHARIEVGGTEEHLPVYVADVGENLLGLDYLQRSRAVLDFGEMTMAVGGNVVPLQEGGGDVGERDVSCETHRVHTAPPPEASHRCRLGEEQEEESLGPGGCEGVRTTVDQEGHFEDTLGSSTEVPSHLLDLLQRSSACLSREQVDEVRNVLTQYADVFSKGDHDLGRTSLVKHHIHTGDSRPVKLPPRRIAPARRLEVEKAVEELLAQGIIEKSFSPWSAAVVLVKKKDGSTRCCVDYRALNAVTTKDSYPLPRVDDTLDALTGAQWFSTLDLKSGYHQVEVAEEDREKTAFSSGQGLYQFKVMSFGLVNAPATFERLMERVLDGLLWKSALVYLDDVLVYGNSFEWALERLKTVLDRFRAANVKLSPKKCCLFQREVPFLGHIVSSEGVKTDPGKVESVKEWPVPRNVTEVRGFIGLCTYYRRFVKGFAQIAVPLHHLTRKGACFQWSEDCQRAFEELKEALANAPVLPYPDPERPYVLDCDASAEGVGAVLSQEKDGQEWVVSYFSKKFSAPEKNYCVTRKELLAVILALDHFHPYLYGAKFKIRTDHAALRWLKTLRNPEGQLARWIGKLEQHDYNIEYRPGKMHGNADSLSRRPCDSDCKHCSRRENEPVSVRAAVLTSDTRWGEDLKQAQREDADIGPIVTLREEGEEKPPWESVAPLSPAAKVLWQQWSVLRLSEGVLQRRWESCDGGVAFWQTIVPANMREALVREAHGGSASGHFGVRKTLGRLKQRVYWVGMRKDVSEWCKVCDVCCAKMGPGRRTVAPLQVYQVGAPMERVAVDILGPFPQTVRGNRFVCVAMDYFTKWPEAYPLPNHEAATVAGVLVDEFFARFGVPHELHSDQGREFESAVFRECCRLLGIKKTRTTPLRPQSDGMVERYNRTLGQELAKYCQEGQEDWDLKIPLLLLAYRSAEHEVTGYTPARLMCGRELRLPVDLVTGRPPDEDMPTTVTPYATALQDRLREVHHQVRDNLKVSGEAMKDRYDRRATSPPFSEGDQVWLHNPRRKKGLSPKLQSPWEGPYVVEKVISDVTFRIRQGPRRRALVVHADRLWRYHGPGNFSWGEQASHLSSDDEEEDHGLVDDEPLVVEDDEDLDPREPEPLVVEEDVAEELCPLDGALADVDAEPVVGRPRRERRLPVWSEDYVL